MQGQVTIINKFLSILIAILLLGCGVCSGCSPGMPPECKKFREFLNLPLEQQRTEFRNYPVERQIDIYLCAMYREPPSTYLAGYIADGGEKVIPFLLERLKTEKSESAQHDIILIFQTMSYRGDYLRGRRDVIDQIRQVVSAMKKDKLRERSQQWLAEIEKASIE